MKSSNSETKPIRVLIVAAETSSVLYARRLLEHWQKEKCKVEAFGVGDAAMVNLGFKALGRSEEMAVVGFQEVVKHYWSIRKVYYSILEMAKSQKPAVALLLDYPGFNLRLAKELKAQQIPVVYYISPQLWAWKKGRIREVQKYVDKMLVVFPFEKDFYLEHKVPVEFVGHPLVEEYLPEYDDEKVRALHRQRYGIAQEHIVLGLMPGSRRSEIQHHLEVQLQTAQHLMTSRPQLKVLLLLAPHLTKEDVEPIIARVGVPIRIVQDDPFRMVNLTDVVLCASGTATLLVGLMKKPMVIMYRMTSFSAWLARRLVTGTRFFGMVNLIFNRKVAPEFFQEEANVEVLSKALSHFLDSTEVRTQCRIELAELQNKLGHTGATKNVAQQLQIFF